MVKLCLALSLLLVAAPIVADSGAVAIAIHGGAGTITRAKLTPEFEEAYHDVMRQALAAGHELLKGGGSAVAAVEAAIMVMEDSPLFNAGKGSVFTHGGRNELDASIMAGDQLQAGAVAGVSHVRNPISLARAVMEQSDHVMLASRGAEEFALSIGMPLVDVDYFYTERRWQQLQKVQQQAPGEQRLSEDESDDAKAAVGIVDDKFGTVGAVALDRAGNVAAGTSTGGMTNKRFGRVGDSPIIGAGTYADNTACAISATGHGEYFIRAAVAHDICARRHYKGVSLQQAADEVVLEKLVRMQGEGGVVGIDADGSIVFSFNTSGMYRGSIDTSDEVYTAIYRDESN